MKIEIWSILSDLIRKFLCLRTNPENLWNQIYLKFEFFREIALDLSFF